ncbi:MAG: SH3 domain-containing protein [Candidatus Muiribacteriota bacterium]
MKKRIYTLIIITFFCQILHSYKIEFRKNFSEISQLNTGVVNINRLNLRSGPSTQYPVIETVKIGDVLSITSHSSDTWLEISLPPMKGYIHEDYLEIVEEEDEELIFDFDTKEVFIDYTQNFDELMGEVTGDNVNVRREPTVESKRRAIARRRTRVKILEKHGEWYFISFLSQREGYVYARYISRERRGKILMDLTPLTKSATGDEIVKYVPKDEEIFIFERKNDYFRVYLNNLGDEGWVPVQSVVE